MEQAKLERCEERDIIRFQHPPRVIAASSVVGKLEHEGPLGDCFDLHDPTDRFGQKTWEKAESEMQRMALATALGKAKRKERDLGAMFAGDLLNQCVSSAYGLLSYDVPYFGLYGACSTAAEGLILAGMAVSAGHVGTAAVVTSSHYCSAERQYRTPLEYGAQRSPTAQWTVTGAGAFLLSSDETWKKPDMHAMEHVYLTAAMPGVVVEKGVSDASNMGAAMMPAVLHTLARWFKATGSEPRDYDLIATGDLGWEGSGLLLEFLKTEFGLSDAGKYTDCGTMIYSRKTQDTHAGGSGCGCSAVVAASWILPRLERGDLRRVLLIGSGAMMSPTSIQQGGAIPGVGHLVMLESR